MSRTIDERVLSMQFDNKQFESGVQTSLGTLEKLKQSLNLSGASKGLENVSAAAKRFDLSPMHNAIETVGLKFSAWYTIADQTLRNIVNSVGMHAKRMVSAFTVDPIKTGMQEYETQINAVQTILANTQSKGTTLDQVNSALDTLNTYADKTIYNFTEMTRNIGTFTAAGVDLDKSVTSIQGIANLAAVSGSTSQQASTAMYQLSQALAAGKVSLMDWNSVVNAGMGGQVFQDALKRTATQMGTNVDALIKKYGSFRESLTQGQWLTAEVLTETLTQLSGAYSEADLIAQGYSEEQAKEIVELSKTAVDAATKVKTFTQLMDTTKEALQSGWTQTWEIIVGDFEEAKELWTSVSDAIGGFINATSERRNDMLSGAMDSNWDKLITKINEAGIETSTFEEKLKETVKEHGYDVDKLIKDHGSLEEAFRSGKISSDILKEAVDGLGGALVDLSSIERDLKKGDNGEDVKKAQEALKALGHDLGKWGVDGIFGSQTEAAVKAFQELNGLEVTGIIDDKTLEALEKATTKANELGDSCDGLIDGIEELGGRELLIESLKNVFQGLLSVIKPIKNAFQKVFPPVTSEQLFKLIEGFHELTSKFKLSVPQTRKVYQTFKGLFSVVDIGWEFIKSLAGGIVKLISRFSGLGNGILDVTSSWGEWLSGLRDSIKEADIFGIAIDKIVGFLSPLIDGLKSVASFIIGKFKMPGFEGFLSIMQGIWNFISKVGSKIGEIGSAIGNALSGVFTADGIGAGLDIFNSGVFAAILLGVKNFTDSLGDTFDGVGEIVENAAGALDSVKGCLEAWQADLKANVLLKIAGAIAILTAAIVVLAMIDPEKLASSLGAITVLFADMMGAMAIFSAISGKKMFGMSKAALLMVGMASAVLILAVALKKLSSLSWEELGKGLVGIVGLTAVVVGAAKILGSGGKTIVKGAVQMVIMAVAVKMLASVCKDIADMKWEELGRGLAGLAGILAMLVIAVKFMSTGALTFVKGAGSMLIMAAALTALAGALHIVAALSWEELKKGLITLGLLLGGLVLAVKLMSTGAGTFVKGAASMVVMSVALTALVGTMALASRMSWESIAKGLVAIGGAMAILAIGLNAMRGTFMGSAALLVATVGLLALTPALMALGSMSWESIAKGLVGVAGAIAVIGIAGLLLGPIVPSILGLGAAFALVGIGVLAVGAGLALVAVGLTALATAGAAGATAIVAALTIIVTGVASLIPALAEKFGEAIVAFCGAIGDSATAIGEAIKAVVLALVDVIVECAPEIVDGLLVLLSEALTSLAEHTPQIVDSLFTFVIGLIDGFAARMPELIQSVVNLVMEFFSGVISAIGSIDVTTLVQGLAGIGIMSAMMMALSAVAGLVPGAMTGVLGMGAVVAEIAVILAALGALNQIPGLDWLISEGGVMLQNIGNAIGGFVGGIIGGIAEGITASLPQIGTDLSNFMTNLTPFLDGARTIDETLLTNVGTLVAVVAAITAASLLESITSFVTGTSSMESFGTQLITFGTAIKEFSSIVSGIDESAVAAAANAGAMMAAMADTIPNSGGVVGFFTGENDLVTFAAQLVPFGTAIKQFSDSVTGLDESAVTAAANAGSMMAAMADTIPNSGGVVGFFTGENDISTFGTQLVSFGTSIKQFSDTVTGIDEAAVTAAANAGSMMSAMADTIPNTGGLISFFVGDNDLTTFGTQIVSFGTSIKSFSDEVSGINPENVTAAADAGTALVSLANSLPESGGLWSVFSADNDMSTFGKEIVKFGNGISEFSTSVAGINIAAINTATTAGSVITAMANSLTADSVANLGDFGGKIKSFGGKLKDFADDISGIDSVNLTTVVTQIKNLGTINLTGLESLGTTLGTIGTEGVQKFIQSFADADIKLKAAGISMVTNLALGMKNRSTILSTVMDAAVTKTITAIKGYFGDFYDAGKYLVQGFALGISTNTFMAKARASAMASAALKAAKNTLDEHSPSRETYKVGAFFGQGFINAIDDYVVKSRRAGESIAESAKVGLSGAIAKVRDMVENGIDTQPTIRPVLDLSNVSSGAGAIESMFGTPTVGAMANLSAINDVMNRNQNGTTNDDVVSAIKDLGRKIGNTGDTYNMNGITYDDGSNISNAMKDIVRAAKIERRT